MHSMSTQDLNILLTSGVIMAAAAVIFLFRVNRVLKNDSKNPATSGAVQGRKD